MSKAKNADNEGKTSKKHKVTAMQRVAFEALTGQIGKGRVSVAKALRKAGYSKSLIDKTPSRVTKSKGWLQLLDEYFPDEVLNQKMEEQLNAQDIEHYTFSSKTPDSEIKKIIKGFGFKLFRISRTGDVKRAYFPKPDHTNRDKVIDKLLKLKNKYPADKHEHLIAKVEVVKYGDTKEVEDV